MGFNKSFVVKNGIEVSTDLLVGEATLNNVGVGTTLPSTKLDVQGSFQASGTGRISGINTAESIFNVGVGGTVLHVDPNDSRIGIHTNVTTNDITIVGHSTVTGNIHVTGITTGDYLTVSKVTTLNHLDATGVSTIANVRVNAGFVTVTQLTSTDSNVTGVSTVGGAVTMSSSGIDVNNIDVEALTGRGINISGDIDATGTIDANNFTGDGSTISGIVTTLVAGPNISLDAGTGTVTITGLAKTDVIQADSLVVTGVSTLGVVTDVPSIQATNVYANQFIGDGSRLTGIDTSGNFQGKTVVCENVDASLPGIGTFGSVVINNPAGRITATEFYGDGANLTNTGSSLGTGSGVERLVTTSLTSGTMTSSSTDPNVVYDFDNDRIGIGTDSPAKLLDVAGRAQCLDDFTIGRDSESPSLTFNNPSYGGGNASIAEFDSGDLIFNTDATEQVRIKSNGTVGIGTETPTRGPLHLHLDATTDCQLHMTNSATGAGSQRGMTVFANDHDCGIWFRENAPLRFATNNTEKVRIDPDGQLLIGATSGEASLQIDTSVVSGVPSLYLSRTPDQTNTSDIALTGNAVIRSDDSIKSVVNDSGIFTWNVGGTDVKAGMSGASEKLRLTSDGKLRVPDNGKFTCGDDDDLEILHNGTDSFISDVGTGILVISGSQVQIKNATKTENCAKFFNDGAVELYHNNSKKFETTSSGVTITGTLTGNVTGDLTGDVTGTLTGTATNATNARVDTESTTNAERYIVFADGGDSSNRRLKADGGIRYNPSTNTITATTFDGNATTATNADNAGTLDGIDSSAFLRSNTADSASAKITFDAGIRLNDEDKAEFGSSADYTIRHSGNNAIHNITTGDIYFQHNNSNKIFFDMSAGNILPTSDNTGNVGTSGNTWNSGRFTNMTIDSTISVRGAVDLADNDQCRWGSSDDFKSFYDGSNNTMEFEMESACTSLIFTDNGTLKTTFNKDGSTIFTNYVQTLRLQTDEIRTSGGTELVLNAGESSGQATGQTFEVVYINAEGGLEVNSSPDNWTSGWAARHTATICNTSGNSSLPGDLTVSGDVNSTSDINQKENISIIENSMSILKEIDGVTFDWKKNKLPSMGVIAQTVEKVLPELVDESEEGIKSVKYNGLVGLLIEAVKELSGKVEELEGKLSK